MLNRRLRNTVSVTVDINLDEIDTDDLIAELESRGASTTSDGRLDEVYYAIKFGQDDRALQLMRKYVCDELGRTL